MQSPARLAYLWMPPVKDVLDVLIWAGAFAGNRITWRGDCYRVLPDGRLSKVEKD